MHLFIAYLRRYQLSLILVVVLSIVSFIYTTHLDLVLIPKGYDLLFHLGNVFSLQVAFGFSHKSLASLAISPIIFHDTGYGTHLFYPPLAHFVPALIAFLASKVGINSTLLAIRLFSFLTIFGSGATMYFAAKKISNSVVYASFSSLLYLSAPYLQWDYYWRGGMSSTLCFVFLPILILSLYYFTKEKFTPYLLTFVTAMSLLVWTHLITAFFSFIFFMLALAVNFFLLKNKKAAFASTLVAGLMIAVMTSPFWSLLLQQQALQSHVINSSEYPFTIESVAKSTIPVTDLFDIHVFVWQWKMRNMFAVFNVIFMAFFVLTMFYFQSIDKKLKSSKFLYSLIGGMTLLFSMATVSVLWRYLPSYFAFIQYPPRVFLQATPILSLFISLPFILIKKVTRSMLVALGLLSILIVVYTFQFNNYQLYDIGKIDYTTFSIVQATGVDDEYLPVNAKKAAVSLEERPRMILALTNKETATPSANITTNETPYLLAEIGNNENKQTVFELPRLFYAGYSLKWRAEGTKRATYLDYDQSNNGLITATISGNGILEVQFTGGRWYWVSWLGAVVVFCYLLWLMYGYTFGKENIWLEKFLTSSKTI